MEVLFDTKHFDECKGLVDTYSIIFGDASTFMLPKFGHPTNKIGHTLTKKHEATFVGYNITSHIQGLWKHTNYNTFQYNEKIQSFNISCTQVIDTLENIAMVDDSTSSKHITIIATTSLKRK